MHRLTQYAPYADAPLGGQSGRHFARELTVSYACSLLVSLHLGHRPEGLARRTEAEIREELRGFPPPAIDAVVSLKSGTDPASLRACLLSVLEFYLPQAARRSLADVPDSARLREDLALDSLALAEAAFKLDEVLGIPVETREVGNLATVGDLHAFFCARLQSDPS